MKRSRHHIAEGALRTYIRSVLLEYPQDVCPKCGADRSKAPTKKFCTKCGVKMGLCPKCEEPLGDKPTQKFCTKCGEKLASPDSGKPDDEPNPAAVKKELEKTLTEAEKLLRELEDAVTKAPETSSKEEKRLYDEIMGPYFKERDRMLEAEPETPQELRAHLKNFRESIKKFKPTLIKLYKAVKDEGKVLSKPVLELLISSIRQEIELEKKAASQAAQHKEKMSAMEAEHNEKMSSQAAEHKKKMDAIHDEIYKKNPSPEMAYALSFSKK